MILTFALATHSCHSILYMVYDHVGSHDSVCVRISAPSTFMHACTYVMHDALYVICKSKVLVHIIIVSSSAEQVQVMSRTAGASDESHGRCK